MTIFNLGYFQAKFLNGSQEGQEQHINFMDLAINYVKYLIWESLMMYGYSVSQIHEFSANKQGSGGIYTGLGNIDFLWIR